MIINTKKERYKRVNPRFIHMVRLLLRDPHGRQSSDGNRNDRHQDHQGSLSVSLLVSPLPQVISDRQGNVSYSPHRLG